MENYIVNKKILTVLVLKDVTTPSGAEMVEINFEDGSKERMPKVRFELLVTDAPSNPSEAVEKIRARVGAILFGALHEYGVKWGEINSIITAMGELADNGFEKAQNTLWGIDSKDSLSLIDINNVLKEKHAKENNDGTSSTGGESN